ncbi:MAG: bifunctional oligoribonuclease/PAP phosphatase NrnA [Schleiferiaceae bacterium]|nr:bifunctional oligoribonuclease/PAP phosphatase NrnA [Schleiferiaceae bacterium]
MIDRIISFLREKPRKIVLTSHRNPDGDAIGSALGLAHYLHSQSYSVDIVFPNPPSIPLQGSIGYSSDFVHVFSSDPSRSEEIFQRADVLFSLDYNVASRVGAGMQSMITGFLGKKIMIDHHESPDTTFDLVFSMTSKSSTCEMVYDLIERDGGNIDLACADNLLMGLITDTGSFRFHITSDRTMHIAGKLIEAGAIPHVIHDRLFDNNPKSRLMIWGRALSNLIITDDGFASIVFLKQSDLSELKYQPGDTEGLVNQGLGVTGVLISIFIREDQDSKMKLSFRSKGEVDVNKYARENWEGGGHKNASGGLSNMNITETIEKFKSTYKKALLDD